MNNIYLCSKLKVVCLTGLVALAFSFESLASVPGRADFTSSCAGALSSGKLSQEFSFIEIPSATNVPIRIPYHSSTYAGIDLQHSSELQYSSELQHKELNANIESFSVAQTPVTLAQWKKIMGRIPELSKVHYPYTGNPSLVDENLPVLGFTRNELIEFLKRLNDDSEKFHYRLITEIEMSHLLRMFYRKHSVPYNHDGEKGYPYVVDAALTAPFEREINFTEKDQDSALVALAHRLQRNAVVNVGHSSDMDRAWWGHTEFHNGLKSVYEKPPFKLNEDPSLSIYDLLGNEPTLVNTTIGTKRTDLMHIDHPLPSPQDVVRYVGATVSDLLSPKQTIVGRGLTIHRSYSFKSIMLDRVVRVVPEYPNMDWMIYFKIRLVREKK